MADTRFPTPGVDGYVSPYDDISYSKGPKIIYGDVHIMRVLLNDPQTDEDDEWGRTEHIALRQMVDETINLHRYLLGWEDSRGLYDEWEYFKENFFSINFTTPASSVFSIGNTVLINGRLTVATGAAYTSTQFTMNSEYFKLFKYEDLGIKAQSGDNSGGAGDVTVWWRPAPTSSGNISQDTYLKVTVNGSDYVFKDTIFSIPTNASFSATSAFFSDLTVSNSITAAYLILSGILSETTTTATITLPGNSVISGKAVTAGDNYINVFTDYFDFVNSSGTTELKITPHTGGVIGGTIMAGIVGIYFGYEAGDESEIDLYASSIYFYATDQLTELAKISSGEFVLGRVQITEDVSSSAIVFGSSSIALHGVQDESDRILRGITRSLELRYDDDYTNQFFIADVGLLQTRLDWSGGSQDFRETLTLYSTYFSIALNAGTTSSPSSVTALLVEPGSMTLGQNAGITWLKLGPSDGTTEAYIKTTYNSSGLYYGTQFATDIFSLASIKSGSALCQISTDGISTIKNDKIMWTHFSTTVTTPTGSGNIVIAVPAANQVTASKILSISVVVEDTSGSYVFAKVDSSITQIVYTTGNNLTLSYATGGNLSDGTSYSLKALIIYIA